MASCSKALAVRTLTALVLTFVIWQYSPLKKLDQALSDLILTSADRAASGEVIVIEANARDLAEYGGPPLNRSAYAAVVTKLHRAGAERVLIDVIFEAELNPESDTALTEALALFGPAALAIGATESRSPLAKFAAAAQAVDVNYYADHDGWFRAAWFRKADGSRPPAASWLVETHLMQRRLFIDQRIDPETIPVLSVRDALRTPDAVFSGKRIVIGVSPEIAPTGASLPFRDSVSRARFLAAAVESSLSGFARNTAQEKALALTVLLVCAIAGVMLPGAVRRQVVKLVVLLFCVLIIAALSRFTGRTFGLPTSPTAYGLALSAGMIASFASRMGLFPLIQNLARGDLSPEEAWAWAHYSSEVRPVLMLNVAGGLKRANAAAAPLLNDITSPVEQLCMPRLGERAEQIELATRDGEMRTFSLRWPHAFLPIVTLNEVSHIVTERRELERKLAIDELTGLASRLRFETDLQEAAQRGDGDYTVVYMDLNGLKSINDIYGHAAGDALLREAAARFRKAVRSGDTLARLGGDEFAILVTSALTPVKRAELQKSLERSLASPIDVGGALVQSGVAVGSTTPSLPDEPVKDVIARADALMYERKRQMKAAA